MAESVVWNPRDSRAVRPPLDDGLAGWEIYHRRSSHLNARRRHEGREYHLKWFFRGLLGGNPALREFRNARHVRELGIPSVVVVGWGHHSRGTFFVMEGSPGLPIQKLPHLPPLDTLRELTVELARLIATLHDADLCHRDLYLDHVLIDEDRIRLIDVGRVMRFRRRRWIVKDLGGLLFSAWRSGLPTALARDFLRTYLASTRRRWNRRALVAAAQKKARGYWKHNEGRRPQPLASAREA